MTIEGNRIRSLDGMRAVSIILVILAHLSAFGSLAGANFLGKIDIGNLGVRCFFVISGYLITHLLLAEQEKTGRISLRDFYIRRVFRIMPAFYVLLEVTALAMVAGLLPRHFEEMPIAAAFMMDYLPSANWTWGHLWSLSVEEQFYLLWPAVLLLIGRRAVYVAIAVLFISPAFRWAVVHGHWHTSLQHSFECVADALTAGCLLALLHDQMPQWYLRFIKSPFVFIIPVLVFGGKLVYQNPVFWEIIKVPAYNLSVALLIDRYTRFDATFVGRMLNTKPFVWVGTLSYSLYLWQQIYVAANLNLPTKLLYLFGTACLSYYLIEKPALRLRKRFEVSSSRQPALQAKLAA